MIYAMDYNNSTFAIKVLVCIHVNTQNKN